MRSFLSVLLAALCLVCGTVQIHQDNYLYGVLGFVIAFILLMTDSILCSLEAPKKTKK